MVVSEGTGPYEERGTWIHPRVAIDLARWCSSKFAVWALGWVYDYMRGQPALPVFRPPSNEEWARMVLAEVERAKLMLAGRQRSIWRSFRASCKFAGRYSRLTSAKDYLAELSAVIGIPITGSMIGSGSSNPLRIRAIGFSPKMAKTPSEADPENRASG